MKSVSRSYHVRVGSMGELWHCATADDSEYRRGERVICRTPRGLEIGTVTAPGGARSTTPESLDTGPQVVPSAGEESSDNPDSSRLLRHLDGKILRRTTTEDELLDARLLRYKARAVESCRRDMRQRGLDATLIDVDHLFDGRTLIFYFLGPISDELQGLTDSLSARYEQRVRSKHFAKLLAEGCGPGCGTDAKGGCGTSGGCAVCLAASVCAKP